MAKALEYTEELITPAKAEEYLQRNSKNRQISPKTVAAYARDMENGDWLPTGEAIKFDVRGNLLDGQHRLAAIIRSGIKLKIAVIRNVIPDARKVMDTGRRRSVSDNLSMDFGVKNPTQVASAARIIIRWRSGLLRQSNTFRITDSEIYEFVVENDPALQVAASFGQKLRRSLPFSLAAVTAAHVETNRVNEDAAKVFWDKVLTGAELRVGDPALSLRNTVVRLGAKHEDRTMMNLELICRAWRFHVADRNTGVTFLLKPLRKIQEQDFRIDDAPVTDRDEEEVES
jgi:hypothetical protein